MQGGIISPTLANMALDGIQHMLADNFKRKKIDGEDYSPKINFVRYADDFIITGARKDVLEKEVKPMLVEFLSVRGLTLSEEKTLITHIDNGFDFLGFNMRKFKGTLLTQPSKKKVKKFLDNIRDVIDKNKSCKQETLIRLLNPKITGWANYYRCGASSKTFANVDHHIWWALWRWAKRRHSKKGKHWILDRYFHQHKGRSNNFLVKLDKRGKVDIFPLKLAFETKIIRHVKIDSKSNPFDTDWHDYFEERETYKMTLSLKGRSSLLYMWRKQNKLCPICNKPIDSEAQWNVREQNTENGKSKLLVHDTCYKAIR